MDLDRYRERLMIVFVVGLLAFNYPLLALADRLLLLFGVPLLYGYLFLIWLGLIFAVALVSSAPSPAGRDEES